MIHRSANELREEMRQRELFFAHIAAQADEARRATMRRHMLIGALTLAALIVLAILLR